MMNMKEDENQQQSEYQSITKSDSTSQVKSVASCSKMSHASSSIVMMDVVKCHLQGYEDVNDQEFELLPNQPPRPQSICSEYSSYMNYHATVVPIGSNFQATIPPIMTTTKYFNSSEAKLKALQDRKVHDPQIDAKFYQKYQHLVQSLFGQQRTYEDVNQVRISYAKRCSPSLNFQQYLKQPEIFEFWDDYFAAKQKVLNKIKRRRRKVK